MKFDLNELTNQIFLEILNKKMVKFIKDQLNVNRI
jgi:hypothetical protein